MLKTIAVCIVTLLAVPVVGLAQQPTPSRSAPATSGRSAPATGTRTLASNQFTSEQAAKSRCPGGPIVWANLSGSKAYHMSGDKYYGKTRHGAYMCQKDADQSGFHASGRSAKSTAANATTK